MGSPVSAGVENDWNSPKERLSTGHEALPPDDGHLTPSSSLLVLLAMVVLLFGAAILDEPYHVDELRQTGYYAESFVDIADRSFSQQQPPLDYYLGAATERLFGDSRFVHRLHSTLLAGLSCLLVALLMYRSGNRRFFWLPSLVMLFCPVFLRIGAYARPYSLPLVLMLGSLVAAQRWKMTRSRLSVIGCVVLLPLLSFSRASEPLLFLTGAGIVLVLFALRSKERRSLLAPALGFGLAALAALWMYWAGSEDLALYRTSDGINDWGVIWSRLGEAVETYRQHLPAFWPLVGASTVGLILAAVLRRNHSHYWWLVPLVVMVVGFPPAFVAVSWSGGEFFDRYVFFGVVPVAIGIGIVTDELGMRLPRVAWIPAIALLVAMVPATVSALRSNENPDYWRTYEMLGDVGSSGNALLFEEDSNFDAIGYRPGPVDSHLFAQELSVIRVEQLATGEMTIGEGRRPLLLYRGSFDGSEDWSALNLGTGFTLVLPRSEGPWSSIAQADGLASLCQSLPPEFEAFLCMAAVRLFADAQETERANELFRESMNRLEEAHRYDTMANRMAETVSDLGFRR